MMTRALKFAAVLTTFALAGCGATTEKNAPADIAAINALRTAYQTAFNAGDVAAVTALYTPNGVSANNHQPTADGGAAITAKNKEFFGMFSAKMELTPDETMTFGDMGHERGRYKMTLTPKAGGAPMTDEGRYAVFFQKQADGAWKATYDVDNSSMPMPPPPAPATTKPKGK